MNQYSNANVYLKTKKQANKLIIGISWRFPGRPTPNGTTCEKFLYSKTYPRKYEVFFVFFIFRGSKVL